LTWVNAAPLHGRYRAGRRPVRRAENVVNAIGIIHSEHRSLAAVLHAMLHFVREIRLHGAAPDFRLFGAIVYYIDTFPERFHHPKEDAYLFRFLLARHPDAKPVVDRLTTEHRAGAERIGALVQTLERYREGGEVEFAPFATAVHAYASFHWNHMRVEEDRVLPLARAHLSAGDWNEIDAAFAGNVDPLLGAEPAAEFEALFRRIVMLAPPPIGAGSARH
jgi:branched-chain amino acid transport system ATP-binding protein